MAVEIGSHSDRYKVYKKSQRGLLKKIFISLSHHHLLYRHYNGVAPQCPNNVGHTSPEQPIPLSVKYKVDIPASPVSRLYINVSRYVTLTGTSED